MRAVLLELPRAHRVLDLGCGTGWVLGEARATGSPLLVGLDASFEALEDGKGQFPIDFVGGDGASMPFADESFDVVVGHVSMPYMNTRTALREIYRVLMPGGSLFLTFHSFRYARERFIGSLHRGNAKDLLFCLYMAVNGMLNQFGLPQGRFWLNPDRFETINVPRGVCKTAQNIGFTLASAEDAAPRIFFAFTARKPNRGDGPVLPAAGWAAYCPLSDSRLHE